MYLVYKKNGLLAVAAVNLFGILHHFFHVFFARDCGVYLAELGLGGVGDDFRKSSLTCTGRTVKNDGA